MLWDRGIMRSRGMRGLSVSVGLRRWGLSEGAGWKGQGAVVSWV